MRRSPPSAASVLSSWASFPRATSRKSPRSSSQSRSTIRGRDRGLAGGDPRQAPEDVGDDLAEHRTAGVENPPGVPAAPAVAGDQEREQRPGVGAQAPDRVELRRGVEPRLVRLDDPEQAVAVEVAVGLEPAVVGGDPRLVGRVPDRDPPGPGEQRRLDRGGVRRLLGGDVVGPAPLPVDVAVPEDRVADEAVLASRRRAGCGARSRRGRGRSGARRSRGSRSPSTTATGSAPGSAASSRSGPRRARPRSSCRGGSPPRWRATSLPKVRRNGLSQASSAACLGGRRS